MTDLFVLQTALAHAINADPVLCLTHVAAWLDPLHGGADDLDMPEGEDDTMFVALHILRRAFPEIYFDALQAIRYGATYPQLDQLICGAVQAQGIPLENLEWMSWGIPLPAYGATLDDPDFYAAYPDVLPVLACFGISPEPNPYNIAIPEVTYKVADMIADELLKQEEDHWRQVGWLLKWAFSLSKNSSVDWNDSLMSEIEPLSWDADDIAFAHEIIKEADGIMSDAHAGLKWINQHLAVLEILTQSIQKVYRNKGKKDAHYKFEWPRITQRDERRTESVA